MQLSNRFQSNIFVEPEDNTITFEEPKTYSGSLVIVPTPIGNLGDLSLRQYEALVQSDIIACEDTRKTGKMLDLIKQRRMKEQFRKEFGSSIEDFLYEDEELAQTYKKSEQEKQEDIKKAMQEGQERDSNFHLDDILITQLSQANREFDNIITSPHSQELKQQVHSLLQRLESEIEQNKFVDVDRKDEDGDLMANLNDKDREFIKEVNAEYYKRVFTSEDYYKRKKLILYHLDVLQRKVEKVAKGYDDYQKLRFIMLEKARHKRSVVRSFQRADEERRKAESQNLNSEENKQQSANQEDEFDVLYGIDNNYVNSIREQINKSKKQKGRGLLLSFFEFNQDKRIPRLIRAMKLGFRVALVSDAGTPTISDPGYKFLREAKKEGISIEALPGPCAAITALSASGFPTEKFQFHGYLSKTESQRLLTLQELKEQGKTFVVYESPNRLMRTLASLEQVFGAEHEVYIGMELTKLHERHFRDTIERLKENIEHEFEGRRLKGEVTMVVAPFRAEEEEEVEFESNKEAEEELNKAGTLGKKLEQVLNQKEKVMKVQVEVGEFARKLNNSVDMSEHEFRLLLEELFGKQLSGGQIKKVARTVRKGEGPGRFIGLLRGLEMQGIVEK